MIGNNDTVTTITQKTAAVPTEKVQIFLPLYASSTAKIFGYQETIKIPALIFLSVFLSFSQQNDPHCCFICILCNSHQSSSWIRDKEIKDGVVI